MTSSSTTDSRRPRGGRALLGLLALGGALGLGATAFATTQDGPGARAHGWHAGPVTLEDVRERVAWGAERALDRVDATPEQRVEVEAILDDALPEGVALRADGRALKADLRDALLQPQVDPAEVESIRQEGLALADRASAHALGVVVELAQTLTLEQRAELDAAAQRWHRSGPRR